MVPQQIIDFVVRILGSVGLSFQNVLETSGLVVVVTQWVKQYVPVDGKIVVPLWGGNTFTVPGAWILALVIAGAISALTYYGIGVGAILVATVFTWGVSVFAKSTINQFRTGRSVQDKRNGG